MLEDKAQVKLFSLLCGLPPRSLAILSAESLQTDIPLQLVGRYQCAHFGLQHQNRSQSFGFVHQRRIHPETPWSIVCCQRSPFPARQIPKCTSNKHLWYIDLSDAEHTNISDVGLVKRLGNSCVTKPSLPTLPCSLFLVKLFKMSALRGYSTEHKKVLVG